MSYLGNQPTAGENNSFKILDDITTYTLTFDGSSSSVVSVTDDKVTRNEHRFITGQRVTYTHGGGTAIGGLTSGSVYYIIKDDQNSFKFASSYANAISGTAINITALGTGSSHTVNVAFDGVNTKFKATYDNGTKAQMSRAAQLQISINGVIQQPQDTTSPTNGFGIDLDSVIIFSVAPISTDIFWGNLVANNFPTFDISDNTIDNFTGNASQVSFTLSKTPANSQNILVTLDGVVQYPSDNTTTRSYTLSENVLTFDSAPGSGVLIQVRHIGFAGATSSNVTGFYGRTGNVALRSIDNITVGNVESVGFATFTAAGIGTVRIGIGSTALLVEGNARVTGILTVGTGSLVINGLTNTIAVGTTTGIGQTVGFTTVGLTVGESFIRRNAVGLGTTSTTGRNAGVSTAQGTLIFNSDTGSVQVYNGNAWRDVGKEAMNATGGYVNEYIEGGRVYRAHIFTSSGFFTVNSAAPTETVDYLVVGGGGAGGLGGGGAGGYRTGTGLPVSASPGSYPVTVGAGGNGKLISTTPSPAPGTSRDERGGNGTPSIFSTITATGGGGGGAYGDGGVAVRTGADGGSGGGGGGLFTAQTGVAGGSGNTPPTSPPQGNPGGASNPSVNATAGGGGGASSAGGDGGASVAGAGGNGNSSSITGITTTYAGGGGGGAVFGTGGTAGTGGGGTGGAYSPSPSPISTVSATSGTVATGGGGGGGGGPITGAGGSGIVVVRYEIGQVGGTAKATGGAISYTPTTTVHTFYSSGVFTVTNPALSSVDYLVVAGGGGGGGNGGGGGGAGGYRAGSGFSVSASPGSYNITVGAGGGGAVYPASVGLSGSSSVFSSITSAGGGGGNMDVGTSGGSGGGGGRITPSAGGSGNTPPVTPPQGSNGGNGFTSTLGASGGGGGAGGAGANAAGPGVAGANGGSAVGNSISGSFVYYAGGGGGGGGGTASGGLGGGTTTPSQKGGAGDGGGGLGTQGTANTGGGGGGANNQSPPYSGASGGSGIVIIAYPS